MSDKPTNPTNLSEIFSFTTEKGVIVTAKRDKEISRYFHWDSDPHFEEWAQAVNYLVCEKLGMGLLNFEDWCYADSYEAGDTPEEAYFSFLERVGAESGFYYDGEDKGNWYD